MDKSRLFIGIAILLVLAATGDSSTCKARKDAQAKFEAIEAEIASLKSYVSKTVDSLRRKLGEIRNTSECFIIDDACPDGDQQKVTTTTPRPPPTPGIRSLPEDCAGWQKDRGARVNGIYTIFPKLAQRPFQVLCDLDTDGGGWTVFQRRGEFLSQQSFQKNWTDYKNGFGQVTKEFWLGNEKIHALTNPGDGRKVALRIDLQDFEDERRFATYSYFVVGPEEDQYRTTLGAYGGNAGDSMTRHVNNSPFSTRDRQNDGNGCAARYHSGWWFGTKSCFEANLNGIYYDKKVAGHAEDGIVWSHWKGSKYSLKATEMKVRPQNFK